MSCFVLKADSICKIAYTLADILNQCYCNGETRITSHPARGGWIEIVSLWRTDPAKVGANFFASNQQIQVCGYSSMYSWDELRY